MKKLLILPLLLIVLTACNSNKKNQNNEKSKKTDRNTDNTEDYSKNDTYLESENGVFLKALQGEWNRTTYPFGTIEFENNKVKITEGEGMPTPPLFQNFTIADNCPYDKSKNNASSYLDFIILEENKDCNSVKLKGDSLFIGFALNSPDIIYIKSEKNKSEKFSTNIPENIRGTWALSKQNCDKLNPQQITIDSKTIKFFEGSAELLEITELEPTRIVGKFSYTLLNGKVVPYQMILDAQDNGNVLVRREYGENSKPGPIKYVRCH